MSARDAFLLGIRDASPTYPGAMSFALVTGVTTKAVGIDSLPAILMSFFIFSGTAQLAALQLYAEGASLFIILLTAASVNFRYLIYSATLSPYLKHFSLFWRSLFAAIMVDQTFAFGINRFQEDKDLPIRPYYLGISIPLVFLWGGTCAVGILIGTQVPKAWSLEFSLPLVFLALVAITIKSKAGVVAAIVGGCVAAMLTHLPSGVGLIIATIIGIAAALVSERWFRKTPTGNEVEKSHEVEDQEEVENSE